MPAAGAAPLASPYDPFDPEYVRAFLAEVFEPFVAPYFRPRLIGAGRLPRQGPAVLAANHSGTAFPWDGMVLTALLWKLTALRPETVHRTVFEKELSVNWWMRPYGLDNLWRRGGGVDMTFDNFDRLLARGDRVLYFPEGVPGIGKGFHRRYELQRFSSSFVTLAARHGAPVVPIHIVNAEWVIPFNFTLRAVDRLAERLWGVPFLPLPAAPLGVLLPWMWYLALPARLTYVVEEPWDVRSLLREEGETDFDSPDRAAVRRVAERLRQTMQERLRRHVRAYGRRPYHWRLLRRRLGRPGGAFLESLPIGWPLAFVRFHRDRQGPAAKGLRGLLRDWDLLAYYLPLGWPLLTLTRRLRRPPCGYRGLSPVARRKREGSFYWHLAERPLPPRR